MILGVDASLTSTAVAHEHGITMIRSRARGMERIDEISFEILNLARPYKAIVVIEGYSFGSHMSHAHELGELGGVIRWRLWREDFTVINVPPSSLKRFATGKGNASKADMISAAVKRSGLSFSTDDAADAWWLYAIGRELEGEPVVALPELQRAAIAGLGREPAKAAR